MKPEYYKKSFYRIRPVKTEVSLPFSIRSVGHYRMTSDWRQGQGNRDFVQLYWCLHGKGKMLLDGKEVIIEPDHVFYYYPYEYQYTETVSSPWEYRWITFDGPLAFDIIKSFNYPREPFHAGNCPETLFETLEKRIHYATINEKRSLTTIAWQILVDAGAGKHSNSEEEKLLQRFFDLVRDNYENETINVNVIADLLNVHRSTLTRIVKQHAGISPGYYLHDFRVMKALEMLRDSNLSASQIAKACGIPDPCYFSNVIRRTVNCSPIAYRKHFR